MKGQQIRKILLSGLLVITGLITAGCSRAAINYQIAEAIGTVGEYDNGEPVETPQMREEREQKEARESELSDLQVKLDEAQALADSYYYEDAIAYLENLETNETTAGPVQELLATLQEEYDSMQMFEGTVPHLCFPVLIEDTDRAFDGDDQSYIYRDALITVSEFKAILQELYDNNYVLVRLHDVAHEETDDRGVTTMERQWFYLPEGKHPIVISQDNLNYVDIRNGDGIATALALDENGDVKAKYTDPVGHDLKGDYDLIPILNTFVEEHPTFSYRGARGIVSVSASDGIFGYDNTTANGVDTISQIAEKLRQDGWDIACAGYDHTDYMNAMDSEELTEELEKWEKDAGSLVGDTEILFYPYGAEVEYPSKELDSLLNANLLYLCGLWGTEDIMELDEAYLRQTRRFIDGYSLVNGGSLFQRFFNIEKVLDRNRQ